MSVTRRIPFSEQPVPTNLGVASIYGSEFSEEIKPEICLAMVTSLL